MKTITLTLCLIFSQSILAKIEVYESTDNTGINKLERIQVLEKYLITLSASLKNLENKIDQDGQKITELEKEIITIKELDQKRTKAAMGEMRNDPQAVMKEIDKLKADVLTLKNDDIEKLKADLLMLNRTMKEIRSR